MALTATGGSNKTEYEKPQDNNHMARLVGLVDLGEQPEWVYQGEVQPAQEKVLYLYELVSHEMKDGRPFWVDEDVNRNDYPGELGGRKGTPSKMMKRAYALNMDVFEDQGRILSPLVNSPCFVTTKVDEKGWCKIKEVSGCPEGIPVPELRNPVILFSMDDEDIDFSTWDRLSNLTKKKIQQANNFPESPLARALAESDAF